jgi:hypothetical protein
LAAVRRRLADGRARQAEAVPLYREALALAGHLDQYRRSLTAYARELGD